MTLSKTPSTRPNSPISSPSPQKSTPPLKRPDWEGRLFTPTRCTAPLDPYAGSLFDRYARVIDIAWREAFGHGLDQFQADALRAITELGAFGTLRHRQFLLSMGRQNGKTEIAAALGLLMLLHNPRAAIIGIASNAEQAGLVYRRVMGVIRQNPALRSRFNALTDTRGIRTSSGGYYTLKPAKSAALQGEPIDLGIVDEVHLLKSDLWSDLVNGTGGRPNCVVVGITTAGDDDAELLKHLYKLAAEGKIGHIICEAPEPTIPEDDATLWQYLAAANPSYVVRPDIADNPEARAAIIQDVRSLLPASAIRYRLNLFTAADNVYLPVVDWLQRAGEITPPADGVTFVLDRTPSWTHASIAAAWRAADGTYETQIVASVASPSPEKLVDLCVALAPRHRLFAADAYSLGSVLDTLKQRGYRTKRGTLGDVTGSASRLYAHVKDGTVRHVGDPLLTVQLPRTGTKNVGDNFRLVRKGGDIDAVVATAGAVYFAETAPDVPVQIF